MRTLTGTNDFVTIIYHPHIFYIFSYISSLITNFYNNLDLEMTFKSQHMLSTGLGRNVVVVIKLKKQNCY